MSSVAEIRYSDVASFVGHSLLQDRNAGRHARRPPPPKVGARSAVSLLTPSSPGASPSSTRRERKDESDQLPPIAAEKAARLKTQLSLLQAEQAVQQEQVRKLQHCLSDSIVLERKVKERTAKNRELHRHHKNRCDEVERAIYRLREELLAMQPMRPGPLGAGAEVEEEVTPKHSASVAAESKPSVSNNRRITDGGGELSESADPGHKPRRRESIGGSHPKRRSSQASHSKRRGSRESRGSLGVSPLKAASDDPFATPRDVEALSDLGDELEPTAAEDEAVVHGGCLVGEGGSSHLAHEALTVAFDLSEEADVGRSMSEGSDGFESVRRSSSFHEAPVALAPLALLSVPSPTTHSAADAMHLVALAKASSLTPYASETSNLPLTHTEDPSEEDEETPEGYLKEVGKPEKDLSKSERAELARIRREVIRSRLIAKVGSARHAFRLLDLNGNGTISHQEFGNGLESLGIRWLPLTGVRNEREFFRLFDEDHDHVITFQELFPEEYKKERAGMARVPTPEFARRYGREREQTIRLAEWQPKNPEQKIAIAQESVESQEEGARKKKWMQATMRRLKGKGKSDARCRELVALHLPHGTGPRDRDGVHMFSSMDLRGVKQTYTDQIQQPIREATKIIQQDLRDLRREQKQIVNKLYQVTEAEAARARAAEKAATGLSMALFGDRRAPMVSNNAQERAQAMKAEADSKNKAMAEQAKALLPDFMFGRAPKTVGMIAQDTGIPESQLSDIQGEFLKLSESHGKLGNKNFQRLLRALAPTRTLVESDLQAWWVQIVNDSKSQQQGFFGISNAKIAGNDENEIRRAQCDFEQFAHWYASCELRTRPSSSSGHDG